MVGDKFNTEDNQPLVTCAGQPAFEQIGDTSGLGGCFLTREKVSRLAVSPRDPMDCSPPGSYGRGILQARILAWVAIPFSRGSS